VQHLKESFESEIFSMSSSGAGLARHPDGFVVFVSGAWVGDFLKISLVEKKKNFATGKIVEVLKPSAERVDPRCPHFGYELGQCGGCAWQIGSYASQLAEKDLTVKHSLNKLQSAQSAKISKAQPSPKEWGYRNRARLQTDGSRLGYLTPQTHQLAPIEDCIVLKDQLREKLLVLKDRLRREPFDLAELSADDKSLLDRKTGFSFFDLDEDLEIEWAFPGQVMKFRQANDEQNQFMKNWVLERCALSSSKGSTAIELFSGEGNFTEVLVRAGFQDILALEGAPTAVDALNSKNLKGVDSKTENLFLENFVARHSEMISKAELLLLDPPRDGWKLKDQFLAKAKNLKKIIYVSCHMATFLRDAQDFERAGFRLVELQPVDQFPQTPHLEVLAVLEKN